LRRQWGLAGGGGGVARGGQVCARRKRKRLRERIWDLRLLSRSNPGALKRRKGRSLREGATAKSWQENNATRRVPSTMLAKLEMRCKIVEVCLGI